MFEVMSLRRMRLALFLLATLAGCSGNRTAPPSTPHPGGPSNTVSAPPGFVFSASYRLITRDGGTCMATQDVDTTSVWTWPCRTGDAQIWQAAPAGTDGAVYLVAKSSGKCLTLPAAPSAAPEVHTCANLPNQIWQVRSRADGFQELVVHATQQALQSVGVEPGTVIGVGAEDPNSSAQAWVAQHWTPTLCDSTWANANVTHVRVADFGAKGDGLADDGPAIGAALAQAQSLANSTQQLTVLEFAAMQTYNVRSLGPTAQANVLLSPNANVVIFGNASTLLLQFPIAPFYVSDAAHVALCDVRIDYSNLPFTQGAVVASNPQALTFDFLVEPGYDMPGFAADSSWQFGIADNYGYVWIQSVAPIDAASTQRRIVRVAINPAMVGDMNQLTPGTLLVFPVHGIGHQGTVAHVQILESNDITLANVSVYACPFFNTLIERNTGPVTISHGELRPKPGSNRRMSGWRDGYHVKDNRGALLFSAIWVEDNHDDAFNISAHWNTLETLVSATELVVGQPYGAPVPQAGDSLQIVDPNNGNLVGEVQVAQGNPVTRHVVLAAPVSGLAVNQRLINLERCNPNTLVQDSTILNTGVRLRSPVRWYDNRSQGGLVGVLYDPQIEGPIPRHVDLQRNNFGPNAYYTFVVDFDDVLPAPQPILMQDIVLADNTFRYVVKVNGASSVQFLRSNFVTDYVYTWLDLNDARQVQVQGSLHRGAAFPDMAQKVGIQNYMSASDVTIQ